MRELLEYLNSARLHGDLDPEEPVFLLRGSDMASPVAVDAWAVQVAAVRGSCVASSLATRLANEMRAYPDERKTFPSRVGPRS